MRTCLAVLIMASLAAGCGGDDNHAPTIAPLGDAVVELGDQLAVSLRATDADGDAVSLAVVSGPDGVTLTGDDLTWTPVADDIGSHWIAIVAADSGDPSLSAYVGFTVTVVDPDATGPNLAPAFGARTPGTAEACVPFEVAFEAIDPEAGQIT